MKTNRAFVAANEKTTANKVKLVSWSSKFDLLAVTTASAKLYLFRLITKEKVWIVPAPDHDTEILSICWRPDGKVIAVSYSKPAHGVQFICMETHTKSRKFNLDKNQTASLLNWVDVNNHVAETHSHLEINSEVFLPTIPLWQCDEDYKKKLATKEPDPTSFNVLLICDELCRIFVLANGLFPIQLINYSDADIPPASSIRAVHISSEMTELSIAVMSPNRRGTESTWLKSVQLSTDVNDVASFEVATKKTSNILSLQVYLEETLTSVTEQCEVVSQHMETHLVNHFMRYAKSPDTIGEDLLQMLIWGKVSCNLEILFTNHVSKRDIKKLISLTESTYTKIQQDLTLNFQNALMNTFYHLTELKGIILGCNDALPLTTENADDLLQTASALMFKTAEFLQVIDSSLKTFNLFFRWLSVKAAKIQNEPVDNIPLVHSRDMIFVANFINENFSFQNPSESRSGKQFQLDKVYQYLKDEDLAFPKDVESNEWLNYVNNSAVLSNSPTIIKPQPKKSLRQLFNAFSKKIDEFIRLPKFTNAQLFKSSHKVELFQCDHNETPAIRFWIRQKTSESKKGVKSEELYAVAVKNCGYSTKLVLYQPNARPYNALCARLNLSDGNTSTSEITVCDFHPYNDNTITLLLKQNVDHRHKCYLAQLRVSSAIDFMQTNGLLIQHSTSSSLIELSYPSIDVLRLCYDVRELDMRQDFSTLAVSGYRKVACVVASDMTTIYPFLMDSREEDEEEDASICDEDPPVNEVVKHLI